MTLAVWLGLAGSVPAADEAAQDDVLRAGVEAEIQGFDPLRTPVMGVSTLTAARLIFDTLIDLGPDGTIEPALAVSLTPSDDLTSWTATLRPDVQFSDGAPFDAAAVVAHFERLLDPQNRCACRTLIAPIARVVAVDARTVRFELKQSWAALPTVLAEPSVVSLIGSPRAVADPAADFQRRPVGAGPYVLDAWTTGDRLVVRRNPRYWRGAQDGAERIELRVLPDEQTRLAALRSGELDVIWTQNPASARKAQDEKLAVTTHVGAGARLLVFNTRVKPLDDRRVRAALAAAIDARQLASVFTEGRAPAVADPYGPKSPFACAEREAPQRDLARARALLAEHGAPVTLKLMHTPTPRGLEAGQIMQALWGEAGIRIELEPVEQGQLVQRVLKGDYEIGAWRIRDSYDPDPDLWGLLHSGSPFNVTGLKSGEIDRLLVAGRTRSDVAGRREAYCELSRVLAAEAPFVHLAPNLYFAISGARVRGEPRLEGGILDLRGLQISR